MSRISIIVAVLCLVVVLAGVVIKESMDSASTKVQSHNIKCNAMKMAASSSAGSASQVKKLNAQTTCPVMGNKIDRNLSVDYQGKRIFVCCEGCLSKVKADPEKYIKQLRDSGQEPEKISE